MAFAYMIFFFKVEKLKVLNYEGWNEDLRECTFYHD